MHRVPGNERKMKPTENETENSPNCSPPAFQEKAVLGREQIELTLVCWVGASGVNFLWERFSLPVIAYPVPMDDCSDSRSNKKVKSVRFQRRILVTVTSLMYGWTLRISFTRTTENQQMMFERSPLQFSEKALGCWIYGVGFEAGPVVVNSTYARMLPTTADGAHLDVSEF